MLFTRKYIHAKKSILEKVNVTRKFDESKIAHFKFPSEVGDHLLINPQHSIIWPIITKTSAQIFKKTIYRACGLVVSDLHSETKGVRFESGS